MMYERRDDSERRSKERRRAGRIVKLTDSNFEEEMIRIPVFGLVQFTSRGSDVCARQENVLKQIARDFKDTQRLRVALFEVSDDNREIPTKYKVRRLPTLMMFRNSEVVYRVSRAQTLDSLRKKVRELIATDTRVFIERRHKGERRKGPRRHGSPPRVIMWRDLPNELNTTPWPVVLSINPEDPALYNKFSSFVESVAGRLRIPGLRTLHVVGDPRGPAKEYLHLTVEAPGVAVFNEGRLIEQFQDVGSKASLAKRLRNILSEDQTSDLTSS